MVLRAGSGGALRRAERVEYPGERASGQAEGPASYSSCMFTGLIQHKGRIREARPGRSSTRLVVDGDGWSIVPAAGDSIAVNGVCLTLAELGPGHVFHFDVVPETLRVTTLGLLGPGAEVNLESSVTASSLMGGHIVQGHVDGVASVIGVVDSGEYRVRLGVPGDLMRFMVPKGSVTVEGVSLTLAGVDPEAEAIEVALIPVTLRATTLGLLKEGDRVNLECDVIARTVVHYLRHYGRGDGNIRF